MNGFDDMTGLVEIGGDAFVMASSAHLGSGVERLRDKSLTTYWQSNGERPHTITFVFDTYVTVRVVPDADSPAVRPLCAGGLDGPELQPVARDPPGRLVADGPHGPRRAGA